MRRLATLALLLPLLLAACAGPRGFDRGALSRDVRPDGPPTDEEIARALALRPQLAPPFKLAVAFAPCRGWSGADREAVLEKLQALVGKGAVSQVIPIEDGVAGSGDLRALRLAAARYGADAVLVVKGAAQVDRYNNAGSALYWTVVGLFVVPGTSADALYLASGTLWDVRNGYLYASAEAEGTAHAVGTPFTVDDARLAAEARGKAVTALGEELGRRVQALAPVAAAAEPARQEGR